MTKVKVEWIQVVDKDGNPVLNRHYIEENQEKFEEIAKDTNLYEKRGK